MDYILKGYGMKILIIEDDKFYASNLKKEILKEFKYEVDVVNSVDKLKKVKFDYDLIISDIFMDGYDENYIQEQIIPKKIPIILITGFPDKILKEKLQKLNIVDFIIKTESNRFSLIIDKLKILDYITDKSFLIVDDSKTATLINMLTLKKHYPNTEIHTAKDGIEALEVIKKHKNIKLILTDYEMPNMNGMQLIKKIRDKYRLNDKIIIAISSATNRDISATLLKIGANDFLTKPFIDEELTCRCDNNFKICMLMDEIKELAYKDSLSGLYNRRYFFEVANKIYLTSLRTNKPISMLMCDIDHFKKVNDTYGHQIGDIVIQKTAEILLKNVRKNDVVARYGGEEFVILLYNCNLKDAKKVGDKIRMTIENNSINIDDIKFNYTISIGISNRGGTLENIIKSADDMLYKAKETRNSVVIDNE